jgi:hypothetical protein
MDFLEAMSKTATLKSSLIPDPSPGGRREANPSPFGRGAGVRAAFETGGVGSFKGSPHPSLRDTFSRGEKGKQFELKKLHY